MKLVKIKRTINVSRNNKVLNGQDLIQGTTIEFEDYIADSLITNGIAELVEPVKETKVVENIETKEDKPAPKKRKSRAKKKSD